MIPIRDYNPTTRRPILTVLVIVVCVAVFVLVQPEAARSRDRPTNEKIVADIEFSYAQAAIPCELTQGRPLTGQEIGNTVLGGDVEACESSASGVVPFPDKNVWLSVLVSMFLHGSWIHLGGNILFLWVFGNNVEDQMGRTTFALFYVMAGTVATAAHVIAQVDSTVPLVGASGAIAGVMGAYLVWYPWARVRTVMIFGMLPLWPRLPAAVLLAGWFGSQFFIGNDSGVAWMAHVAGFAFGVLTGLVARSDRGFARALRRQRQRAQSTQR